MKTNVSKKDYDSKKQSLLVWSIGFANRQIIEINKTERKLIVAEIFKTKMVRRGWVGLSEEGTNTYL
ncbi:MAG: hypothetical protein ABIN25_01455 [Ginsengibacter sp.]